MIIPKIQSPATRSRAARPLTFVLAVGAIVLAAGPWLFDDYLLNVLVKAFFFAIAAVTVDLLWGYMGHLTFGQSAFFGLGAYASALVFTHHGLSWGTAVIALGLAVVVPAGVAALLGWLSFYRGASPFFATVMSLVLPIVASQLLLSGGEWTGSSSGLTGYETPDLPLGAWYAIAGLLLAGAGALGWMVVRGDAGRVLVAIRDNELRCAYLGLRVHAIKIVLLVATAVVAGVAGFGYGAFSGVVAPELTGFVFGTELIIWVALGGRATLWGPLAGAVLINVATSYLSSSLPFAWPLVVGVVFVVVIVLLPQGVVPLAVRLVDRGRSPVSPAPVLREAAPAAKPASDGPAFEMRDVAKR